ncbi:MarR family transcriptional regulator [Sulfolobales archaeon HS-7]|nr:MarR family transcriptional regulator [Sulfolobales archaeon HS-7]
MELDLEGLPPSVKLVLKVLEEMGEAKFSELMYETKLPQRTLREAIKILRERDMIEIRPCLEDMRKRIYCIKLNEG